MTLRSGPATYFRGIAKAHILADTARNFITNASLPTLLRAKTVLNDSAILPQPEVPSNRQFAGMARAVHHGNGFAFGVSMSSDRVFNYEALSGDNLQGWHTGDGATYLYNSELDIYSNAYWPTVNRKRLAGTTVDTQTLANSADEGTFGAFAWAGGAELLGLYGATGMELDARSSTLTARKSWFQFDDEIVALGSGITSTDNRTIETIVENRRLNDPASALTVDGVAKPATLGWNETMSGIGWAHLAATGGYIFHSGATVKGLREARTGSWSEISSVGPTTPITRNYATLWFDHGANPVNGTYAYTLLPDKSAAQTSAYAADSDVVILENTSAAHGVRERRLNITAANFWNDGTHTVGLITSDKKSSVLVRETAAQIDVALSDPTQLNSGLITVELARTATGVMTSDPAITVVQLTPTIRFTANMNATVGRTLKITFTVPLATVSAAATDASAAEFGGDTATFTLTRNGPATTVLTVPYTLGGTATSGADFTAPSGSVTFADGETTATVTISPIADALIEGDETVTLNIAPGTDYMAGSAAMIAIHDKPLDAWRFAHFASDLSQSGDQLDPDHDGIVNLLEYATGTNPNVTAPLDLQPSLENGFLGIIYTESLFATDAIFTVEFSTDLIQWFPATVTRTILSTTATAQLVRAQETALAGAGPRFLRLRVSVP